MASSADYDYMSLAIQQMRRAGVELKTGGPFGAVIVLQGKVIAAAGNTVVGDHDPTAHAEINAIRQACRSLHTANLSGAILYSTGECCPMCYAAAYWARISKIYYAIPWEGYSDLFDDSEINKDFAKPRAQRLLTPQHLPHEEAERVWAEFRTIPHGASY